MRPTPSVPTTPVKDPNAFAHGPVAPVAPMTVPSVPPHPHVVAAVDPKTGSGPIQPMGPHVGLMGSGSNAIMQVSISTKHVECPRSFITSPMLTAGAPPAAAAPAGTPSTGGASSCRPCPCRPPKRPGGCDASAGQGQVRSQAAQQVVVHEGEQAPVPPDALTSTPHQLCHQPATIGATGHHRRTSAGASDPCPGGPASASAAPRIPGRIQRSTGQVPHPLSSPLYP